MGGGGLSYICTSDAVCRVLLKYTCKPCVSFQTLGISNSGSLVLLFTFDKDMSLKMRFFVCFYLFFYIFFFTETDKTQGCCVCDGLKTKRKTKSRDWENKVRHLWLPDLTCIVTFSPCGIAHLTCIFILLQNAWSWWIFSYSIEFNWCEQMSPPPPSLNDLMVHTI